MSSLNFGDEINTHVSLRLTSIGVPTQLPALPLGIRRESEVKADDVNRDADVGSTGNRRSHVESTQRIKLDDGQSRGLRPNGPSPIGMQCARSSGAGRVQSEKTRFF